MSESMIRYDRGDDGVVVLTMDDPEQSANTMNERFAAALRATLDRLVREVAGGEVTGVVVTSAKKTFFAGGDLHRMIAARPEDAAAWTAEIDGIKHDLRRLETLGVPVVAAVNGAALGGGLEIALACHHRVLLDVPGAVVGFPEVTLGLLPGAGGVTRTVRMLGLATALTSVLLEGRRFRPAKALEVGLVDEVVTTPAELEAAARAWVGAHPGAAQPWDVPGFRLPGGTPSSPALAALLPAFPATLRKKLKGAPFPAPQAILAAAVEGAQVDVDTALAVETRHLVRLLTSQTAKNMMKAFFFDLNAVEGGASRPAGVPPWRPARVAVLGAGMMGAGIAHVCARAGLDVVLVDVSQDAADAGKARTAALLATAVARGRTTQDDADAVLARITPTAEHADLAGCDLVVEAVVEDPDLKRRVYAEVQAVVPDALLASNTSSLPISSLAQGTRDPGRFVGMHFFSPVERMPLVEVVVGEKTADEAVAAAFDVARLLRKTPIVVGDSRGFFTSRVIGRFMDEAVGMLAEGVPPASVEQAALQAGYPTGPLALTDEVSLALAQRIRQETERAAGPAFERRPSHDVVDAMVAHGRTGRAGRAGFYDYGPDGARLALWPGLAELVPPAVERGVPTHGIPFADLQERMLFAEALDAWRCLDEGVLRSVEEGNVGSILGIGFPAWTGGVLQYVEAYPGGRAGFVARAEELADRYGDRFAPPASLR